tara:strand:- start:166 stop:474 length:309 start_codon:yes stop_codon:yes gene_type:complete
MENQITYNKILDHCQNWWGKEKLSDLYHKKFYKEEARAVREGIRVSSMIEKKYDTSTKVSYEVLLDHLSGKYFLVFDWSKFQNDYGNGVYLFELSDYGHFQI